MYKVNNVNEVQESSKLWNKSDRNQRIFNYDIMEQNANAIKLDTIKVKYKKDFGGGKEG